MPRLSIPSFNRSSPHCRLVGGGRRSPNVSRMKPLDHLDAAHFFATGGSTATAAPSPTPHDVDGSPRLPSVVGGNVAEEYRLLASATHSSPGAADPHQPHSYLELLDLDALRIVFLLLDAMLLLYRITNVYVGGLIVSRRFDGDAGGRWTTSSPGKTTCRLTTVAAGRAPSPTGASNYVDAGDYLQPIEMRTTEPPSATR